MDARKIWLAKLAAYLLFIAATLLAVGRFLQFKQGILLTWWQATLPIFFILLGFFQLKIAKQAEQNLKK